METSQPDPRLTAADIIAALKASGKLLSEWGKAIDGTPMLGARTGGDKAPAIFITAGAHCTETAGIHAALNLLDGLETEHEVHILPLRDPMGFGGVNHCLSVAAGQQVEVAGHEATLDYLQSQAQLVWREGDIHLFKLGGIGFAWSESSGNADSFLNIHARMLSLTREDAGALKPLWGKSVVLICDMVGIEGSDEGQRCWHAVLSAEGEWLHLNRFFGQDDAPPEVGAVDTLMGTVRPGLTCDLHESSKGEGFWMPIPRPEKNPDRVFDMTEAYFDYINSRGYPVMTYEAWVAIEKTHDRGYVPDWIQPEPRLPGFFWIDGLKRGEGACLMDRAGDFGIGFGTEAPMRQPLAMRVDAITNGILAAIKVWENTL